MANDVHHETVLEATGIQARIARVYAEALMGAADKAGQADAAGEELAAITRDVVGTNPRVTAFFASGAISRAVKQAAVEAAAATAAPLVRNFLAVLNQNGRLGLLGAIQAAYQKLRDEAAGRVRVRVTSAVPLSDDQQAALTQTLADTLQVTPVLDARTDPELLGGLVVQVGDRVYDTSVRTRLDNLRNHLMAGASHGHQAQR